ncbi:MAG: glycoside hydrolase, partial [Chloroflexi bacterium]|nr:glycoside hydrolase [Chloroflexota bacterium]
KHAPYKALAETETEFLSPWGNMLPPFSLSPAVPGVLNLLEELYAELLPNFTSGMFNVGCDETVDLGLGHSKTLVEQKGKGRVYLDFLLEIYRRVQSHGRTMQFWGDIINQYPELVREIPGNTIALEWGYEADHDFAGKSKLFADSGVPFYVCPGTSSWRTIAGRTDNCTGNILNAVENGLRHGATGVLNTDWGDEGHWQSLPISYLGFVYGAAMSWAYTQNLELNLPAALDAFAFRDRAGVMGQLAADLGNAYRIPGLLISNSSLMFTLYQRPLNKIRAHFGSTADDDRQLIDKLQAVIDYVGGVIGKLPGAQMAVPDADLIQREFALAARMLIHGAKRGLLQINGGGQAKHALAADLETIEAEYREVWLARNRPGGLDDSARRLTQARGLYQE